jgi:alkyl sulfatase BDS1-like metallo-beta-lactamase superfamily hydrolase
MTEKRGTAIGDLRGQLAGQTLGPGLHILPGQGNAFAIETDVGVVLVDAGGRGNAPRMMEALRKHTAAPVHAICYSHGHHGYNAAVDLWLAHAASRGERAPRLVAHANVLRRYARYRETAGLQERMGAVQFPGRKGLSLAEVAESFQLFDPNEIFEDRMRVVAGRRRVELIHAPSEVDDAIAVWLPDDGLLYGGAATPGDTIPNIGTPLRTLRLTIRWAETLEKLAALGAESLVTEFGPIIEGAAAVRTRLLRTAEALRWLRAEVVARMNRGMDEREILADLRYPPELFDQPWMRPTYGCAEYIVRDLYREENGWWDRNPTSLHPAAPAAAASAVLSALVDKAAVLARARELDASGETQLALHVIDLLALAPGDDPEVVEARQLKAELCRKRAREVDPYVSQACYRSSAALLERGATSWQRLA